jgi:hypothetical protein
MMMKPPVHPRDTILSKLTDLGCPQVIDTIIALCEYEIKLQQKEWEDSNGSNEAVLRGTIKGLRLIIRNLKKLTKDKF